MIKRFILLTLTLCSGLNAKPSIAPSSVAILYNSNNPESSKLAFYYAKARGIPQDNIVGLDTSKGGHITRAEYIKTIQDPLRRHFTTNRWWTLSKSSDGFTLPVQNKIRLLVCMYGVPFGIRQSAIPKAESDKMHITQRANSAAVDSELSVFGVHNLPLQGPVPNKYFKKDASFAAVRELTPYVMVGRIDGPDYATAQRLIDDAIATEKQGLWGMCYLDKALKGGAYKVGDDWLTNIDKYNWSKGLPSTLDSNKQTYLTNYPMRDTSLYYGWYTTHKNGPFLDPDFKFKRGAVAMHLHSYSASNLRDINKHWVGPILSKGAAATVGNVYEPYLQMTHHFDILNERLIQGYSFIEAATMAIPVLSWQNLTVGDPLYHPFRRIDGSGEIADEDKLYRAVNVAFKAWKSDTERITQKLSTAAIQSKDARYYEILGLWNLYRGEKKAALSYFYSALSLFKTSSDKVRVSIHIANYYRANKEKSQAVDTLNNALIGREATPTGKTLKAMLNILNPPAPPVAQPRKDKTSK